MAFVIKDRVQEFTSTTGTGTLTLTGSPDGFETFSSAVGNGNTTYYTISSNTTEFEVGIGTVGAGTLSRDTVISSSNSDALVNFSAGTKNVFVTLPASKTILLNDSGNVGIGTSSPSAKLEVQTSEATAGDNYSTAIRITNSLNYGYGVGIDFAQPPTSGASVAVTGAITNDYDSDNNYSTRFYTFNSGSLSEKMRITSSGNVGINTTAPTDYYADNLVVNAQSEGGITLIGTSAHENYLAWADGTSGTERYSGYLSYNHSSNFMRFATNGGSERMRITSSGNVGIGTTAPDAKLSVNGVASFGDGTALLPSIANFGDLDTGIFFPAADTIAFSEGGAEAMRILNNGNVAIGRTTANFSGLGIDHTVLTLGTTTGMGMLELAGFRSVDGDLGRLIFGNKNVRLSEIVAKRTGADNASALSFSTSSSGSNTERMRIDSSGNVGIGTSSPDYTLSIEKNNGPQLSFRDTSGGTDSKVWLMSGLDSDFRLQALSDNLATGEIAYAIGRSGATVQTHQFYTTDNERMRINSSGNVGIGTTAPDALLSVNGVASFGDGTALLPSIANFGDLNTGMWFPAADTIAFSEGGTEAMRIDSNGAVSIATTSAINGEKLKVQGKVYINAPESDSIFTTGACLIFPQTYNNIRQSTDHSLVFDAWNNGNVNSPLTIKQDGKIGIGTDSPDAKLHVNGLIEANGSLYRGIFGGAVQDGDMTGATGGNGSEVQIQSPSSIRPASLTLGGSLGNNELLGVIGFYNSGNTDGKRLRAYIRSGQEGATANEQGALMVFSTASDAASTPTERMRIDSSGNVGIGTASPDAKLSVDGVASFGDGSAAAPSIANFGDLNTGIFFPAEDTIAFSEGGTEAVRIDSSGNLLVGTTTSPSSPLAGNKYIKLGTPSIEGNGTGDVSVSTTDVSLSNAKGAGFGFVGGYNTSGGAQFNAIVQFTLNGSITVVSIINNTGLTLTFSAGSGILKLKTSSGTVAANYTVIGA
jgi:hypothetical protein